MVLRRKVKNEYPTPTFLIIHLWFGTLYYYPMERTPTLAQLLKQALESCLLDVHTALIGRIENYDASTQLADIQPVLKRAIKTNNNDFKQEDLPLLVDIPILFPRAGGFFISLPIQPGDYVQVIFNETSIDEFITESASTVDFERRFTLQGAVAIPGIFPQSEALQGAHKTNFVVGKDKGIQIHIDGDKIRLGSEKADESLAIASAVKNELEKIRSAFQTHVHASHGAPTTTQIAPMGNIAFKKVVAE